MVKLNSLAESTISLNLSGRCIMLYNLYGGDKAEKKELTFPENYGEISQYHWFCDYMMVGFSNGRVAVVDVHSGKEMWGWDYFLKVRFICASPRLNRVAVVGSDLRQKKKKSSKNNRKQTHKKTKKRVQKVDVLRIFEESQIDGKTEWQHILDKDIRFDQELAGHVANVAWTSDGHILTVSVNNGRVYNFVDNVSE